MVCVQEINILLSHFGFYLILVFLCGSCTIFYQTIFTFNKSIGIRKYQSLCLLFAYICFKCVDETATRRLPLQLPLFTVNIGDVSADFWGVLGSPWLNGGVHLGTILVHYSGTTLIGHLLLYRLIILISILRTLNIATQMASTIQVKVCVATIGAFLIHF